MSGNSGKKYTGFQKRDIVFISIILKRYNTILFRYSLQENDNIILIIGMSKSPVFIRCRLLKCVQVKERFFGLCYWKSTRKKVQAGNENPLFRQSKNIPFGSDKTVLSFALSLRLLAYRSWFKAHICSIHGLLQTHLTFVQIISHIKNLNKTVYCTLCRNRKTWSICHLYTAVHITTPQHIRWLFYIQTTRIFHLCNEHLRLHADLSADKTLLTSVKLRQQNIWPSLARSPLQMCMRTPLPAARGMLQHVCPPQSGCTVLLKWLLKRSQIRAHPGGLGSTTCRKFFLSSAICLKVSIVEAPTLMRKLFLLLAEKCCSSAL